jgi:DNA end-binding protein Ku
LRLALVSIPVEIFPAARSAPQVEFRQIHKKSGKRVRYEKTVPGIGPVPAEEIVKGFEIGRDEYVLLEEGELEALRLESRKTLDLAHFVDRDAIEDIYFEKPYYVVPADDLAEEAYVVLREALKASGKVGLGQLAMRGREHVVALKPCGRGMILETLRYAEEVHKAASYFRDIDDIEPDAELLELATTLIARKAGPFDAGAFRDRYVDAVRALVEEKRRGKRVVATAEEAPRRQGNVIDLMAALKRSVEADRAPSTGRKAAKPPAAGTPAAKAPRRKPAAGRARA